MGTLKVPVAAIVSCGPLAFAVTAAGDVRGDGAFGDFNQAGVGNVSDLVKVSLSNDATNLYITFDAIGLPPATQGLGYRFRANPDGAGGAYCLNFEAFRPGATNVMTEARRISATPARAATPSRSSSSVAPLRSRASSARPSARARR